MNEKKFKKGIKLCILGNRLFVSIIQKNIPTFFLCKKYLDENSFEKRIENIEKGKSYLRNNGLFRSKSNLFLDIQKFFYKR